MDRPFEQGFRMPAEWHPHQAIWLAWPSHVDLWQDDLEGAQECVGRLTEAIRDGKSNIHMLVLPDQDQEAKNEIARDNLPITFYPIPFGDIWLRDTGPLFLVGEGEKALVTFGFNGWGNKYLFPPDLEVAQKIASFSDMKHFHHDFILEGGAIEVDGQGTCITTEACLLNRNRNSNVDRKHVSQILRDFLGIEHIIWLKRGLLKDHTDGHIDNIARFIDSGVVMCMEPLVKDDPNKDILQENMKQLKKSKDIHGKKLDLVTLPSPGPVFDEQGEILPASYLNFLITNEAVIVPLFQRSTDEPVLYRFERAFPEKKIIGIDVTTLLMGGGAIHCITQPEPRL